MVQISLVHHFVANLSTTKNGKKRRKKKNKKEKRNFYEHSNMNDIFLPKEKKKKKNGIYAQIEFRAPVVENPWAAMVYDKTAHLNLLLTKF